MKLHPVTVPYRTAVGVLKYGVLFAFLFLGGGEATPGSLGALVFMALALVFAIGGWHSAYYNRFDYELTEDTFDISSGVVSRRSREIPLARIQNVDVRENFLHRILGIAELNLETAGGSVTEANLRYVGAGHARELQEDIRRRKKTDSGGPERTAEREAMGSAGDVLYEISSRELLLVSVFSIDLRLIALVLFLASLVPPERLEALEAVEDASVTGALALPALTLGVALVFVLWLIGFVTTFTRYYDFSLSRRDDTLLYERGLFNRYSGSIPLDKVQTVSFQDNPLKRLFGYSTLAVDTAGYSPAQTASHGSEVAVPLAKLPRVLNLAREIEDFGNLDLSRPPRRARRRYVVRYTLAAAALTAVLYTVNMYYIPIRVWFLPLALVPLTPVAAHLKWRNRGLEETDDYLVTRNGFWSRTAVVAPYYRVQNVISTSTILQRRWRLATLTVDTAGTSLVSSNNGQAVDYDIDDVDEMRERVHDSLQTSLTAKRLERERRVWSPVDLEENEPDEDEAGSEPDGSVAAKETDVGGEAGADVTADEEYEERDSGDQELDGDDASGVNGYSGAGDDGDEAVDEDEDTDSGDG